MVNKYNLTEATQENDWKYEFKDLPKEENGKAIDYTVSEQPVKGYKQNILWYNYC